MKKAPKQAPRRPASSSRSRPTDRKVLQDQAAFARSVLASEARAIERVAIGETFHEAVDLISRRTAEGKGGAVVVTGLGKSGLVGQKISATLASTGTPSHFLHPVEAMHGDLGKVRRGDVVLALSFGGNTDEVVSLATILRQDGVPVVALVGQKDCDLARLASVALCIGDVTEACPLNLAPTASTTAMLALGDALALCVSRKRNFGVQDFRKVHPGGMLGRQLMPVAAAMRLHAGQNLPLLSSDLSVREAFLEAERFASGGRRVGALLMVDRKGKLAGLFTDGDLRRALIHHGSQAWDQPIANFMTRNPRCLSAAALVRDAVQMVREFRFDEIPVINGAGKPVGMVDVLDLVALKVIEA